MDETHDRRNTVLFQVGSLDDLERGLGGAPAAVAAEGFRFAGVHRGWVSANGVVGAGVWTFDGPYPGDIASVLRSAGALFNDPHPRYEYWLEANVENKTAQGFHGDAVEFDHAFHVGLCAVTTPIDAVLHGFTTVCDTVDVGTLIDVFYTPSPAACMRTYRQNAVRTALGDQRHSGTERGMLIAALITNTISRNDLGELVDTLTRRPVASTTYGGTIADVATAQQEPTVTQSRRDEHST